MCVGGNVEQQTTMWEDEDEDDQKVISISIGCNKLEYKSADRRGGLGCGRGGYEVRMGK